MRFTRKFQPQEGHCFVIMPFGKKELRVIAVALIVTVVVVAFVPGVDDLVEQIFQRYLGRAAR